MSHVYRVSLCKNTSLYCFRLQPYRPMFHRIALSQHKTLNQDKRIVWRLFIEEKTVVHEVLY